MSGVWREAITSLPKKSQPFVWQELQRELKRVRILPLRKNRSTLDSCKMIHIFFDRVRGQVDGWIVANSR